MAVVALDPHLDRIRILAVHQKAFIMVGFEHQLVGIPDRFEYAVSDDARIRDYRELLPAAGEGVAYRFPCIVADLEDIYTHIFPVLRLCFTCLADYEGIPRADYVQPVVGYICKIRGPYNSSSCCVEVRVAAFAAYGADAFHVIDVLMCHEDRVDVFRRKAVVSQGSDYLLCGQSHIQKDHSSACLDDV